MASSRSSGCGTPIVQVGEADLDNELWRFACSFYSEHGVSPACLILQDKLGIDVDILLFAIFAQVKRGILLDTNDLRIVDNIVRDWRGEIVQTLRRVRTRLKNGPAPSSVTEGLRNRLKAAELEAEQIELALLADWLDRQPPRPANVVDAMAVPLTVARYFQAQTSEKPFAPEVDRALRALSHAIHEMSTRKDVRQS